DPLGREGQHLAHKVNVGLLLNQLDQRHSLVGHRRLRSGSRSCNPNLPEDRRWPPASPPAARCAPPGAPRAASYTISRDTAAGAAIDQDPLAGAYRVFSADQIEALGDSFYRTRESAENLGTESDATLDAWFGRLGARIETSEDP